jgi:transcription factor E
MQINFLKKVVENAAGADAVKIVDLLFGKKDVNEFLIAKKLGLTINQTRNLLYRLSHLGIINSIRKKDKRKGWYIYFWTFNVMKSLEVLETSLSSEINSLKNQISSKNLKRFYKCRMCGREVNEETAMLTNFTCTECGEIYDLADNTQFLESTRKTIDKLQKELNSVKIDLGEEQNKKNKKIARVNKKQELEKKKLREKNKKLREKLKKKILKFKKKLLKTKKRKNNKKKIKKKKVKRYKKIKKKNKKRNSKRKKS